MGISQGTRNNGVYGSGSAMDSYLGSTDSVLSASFSSGFSGFALAANNIVLHVTLLNFDLVKNHENALLTWQTSSKINNDYFEIQRPIDGKQWRKISTVKGKENS